MKQLLQNMRDGKTVVEEVPVPGPRAGMALVKVAASLVSAGTERMLVEFAEKSLAGKARSRPDLVKQLIDKAQREGIFTTIEAAFNRLDQPMPLGYSSAGTIVALGEGLEGFKLGQRVACAGGGYAVHAEYNLVPRNLLTALPDNVDFESAAFTTLGAIALHGFRLAEPQLDESVLVIGLGLVGLLAAQVAAAAGCRVFGVDTNPERVALAQRFGIAACTRQNAPEQALAFTLRSAQGATVNRGFDIVLICADTTSNDPVELAGVLARDRGRVVATGAVGLNIPRKMYYEKELNFINSRSYGPGRYDPNYEEHGQDYPSSYVRWTEGRNFETVVELVSSGKLQVESLITHRFSIENAPDAYDVITGKKKELFLGVLLTYQETAKTKNTPNAWTGRMALKKPATFNLSAAGTPSSVHPHTGAGPAVFKLGVLGAGLYANATLLPAIKRIPEIELMGIASTGGLHAQHSGKKFGFAYATSSEDEIINDPNINAIAILTRHNSHAELAARVLQAGKHVFVEKPLAINLEQLATISEQLSDSVGILMTGFNRRFAPLAQQLAAHFASRSEGLYMHYRVNAGYIPPTHWTQDPQIGGGRIIGEACHFVDFLTFLVGSTPVWVSAQSLPDVGKYRQDNVSMTFGFADGSMGIVDYLASGDKSFPKERVEVFCGGRVGVLDDYRALELIHNGQRRSTRSPFRQDKGHFNEMQAFVSAVRGGGRPPIPYEQLIGVTRATLAAVESMQTNVRVYIPD